ncbi:polyprenyl synthetase family protein [Desulfobacula phenolica]|uniref:Geranylgeranyl diphosphate synthase, type II n=1 Tax=Desulfobacula phenolica TaxID=90732 RepID=A0A1H2K3A1_9BACT|nr:farnesyl diphosphate synthase [Desulfobacula phenolica]SDU63032.1 geranylgeranyl diphosphate synthase, type II [Desulfobacula phenolica]
MMNNINFNLQYYLKEKRKLVNQYLKLIFQPYDQTRELIMAMDHSLMAGGKRLRPILSMAAAQACGKDFLLALPACCAMEIIHTYSLIHDDLPAMDDDDLRRGLPTCHKKFSEATAILAGDALLTHAFNVLSNPQPFFEIYPDNDTRLQLISIFSAAAGIQGMVEGQMLDIQSYQPGQNNRLAHLKKIHALKTGKLITASVESGAVSVGADLKTIVKLKCYADQIGLAFQVADDILNIEGDPEIMGKSAGSDEQNDKMTFPAIIGLDESKKYAKMLVENAIDEISNFDETAAPLRAIANYIINRNH